MKSKRSVKKKNIEMAFINVVLYPTEKQKTSEYINLLSSIMGDRVMVYTSTSSNRATLLRVFDKIDDYYHGFFCNAIFSNEDSKTLNVKENTLENAVIDPNKGLDAKDMEFWFFQKRHRFAVYKSDVNRISKFLFHSFKFKFGDEDKFAINIEKDKDTIERIISSEAVTSVKVSVRYTNNDNLEDWESLDADLRNSDTTQAELSLKSSKAKPIKVKCNNILKAFLQLSRSYGTAKAEIVNDEGRTVKIDTKNHPKTVVVDMNQNPAVELNNTIEDIANNR